MFADAHPPRRWPAIALVALAHVLALLWLQALRPVRPSGTAAEVWFELLPAPARLPPPPAAPPPALPHAEARPSPVPAAPTPAAPSTAAPSAPSPAPESGPPLRGSLAERLLQAAGRADAELNKGKPVITGLSKEERLGQAIEAARAAPRLFEAPEIHEVLDPNNSGRRIYKVRGALGTYCIYVESNHALDGRDSMQQGIKPKVGTCPRE